MPRRAAPSRSPAAPGALTFSGDEFRLLRPEDVDTELPGSGPLAGFTLRDDLRLGELPGNLVVVRVVDGKVAALAYLVVGDTFVTIEHFRRSGLFRSGAATPLLAEVEDVARQRGRRELRLEALHERLQEYYEGEGFDVAGPAVDDGDFGRLIRMRKAV